MLVSRETSGLVRIEVDAHFEPIDFDERVLAVLETGDKEVLIDCTKITMLHSPSLATLTSLYLKLQSRQLPMSLCGLNTANKRAFEHTRLYELINVID